MSSTATTPAQDLNAVMASCYTAHPEIEGGRLRAHKIEVHVTLRTIIPKHAPHLPPTRPPLQGDATRLASHPDLADECGTFDAVLLLGPLYHIMAADLRASALRDAWSFVRPDGGVLFCAWVSRYARYRDLALKEPARLARKPEFYARHAQDGVYVKLAPGVEDVEMVGTEGLLAGGLDKLVNELEGEEFEAWVQKCLDVGADEHGWRMADHIVGVAMKV
ncbi:hypothetical protein BD311DRAFT_807754 [Dichomitus squalens]|uniref:Methyltransferase type 11 domain-containing protein n=1 Tax=Dichomitus squalens TaxID=114155 RepID=A0A4Q9MKP8_9APHY|nr:hypothetical protein BD311DRAFT_807754 [Dichomitus squalens]